jgi:hypothetical protein
MVGSDFAALPFRESAEPWTPYLSITNSLGGLLAQIPADEPISTVTADGAYDTRTSRAAIAAWQACAVIPTRRNGRPWKETTPGAQARNEILHATRRFGRVIWKR